MIDDYKIFKAAHEKNYAPLIELLRTDVPLLPRYRDLLIKILEGKLTRPNHRLARTVNDMDRKRAIAARVLEIGGKQTAAIAQTMREFRCSGTVKNALRDHREGEEIVRLAEKALVEVTRLYNEGEPEHMLGLITEIDDRIAELYRAVGLKYWRRPRISEAPSK